MDVKKWLMDRRVLIPGVGVASLIASVFAPFYWVAAAGLAVTYWLFGSGASFLGLGLGFLLVWGAFLINCSWMVAFNHAGIVFLIIAPTLLMAMGLQRRKSLSWAFQEIVVLYVIATALLAKLGLLTYGFWSSVYASTTELMMSMTSRSSQGMDQLIMDLSTRWVAMFLVFSLLSLVLARWAYHRIKPDALVWGSFFQIKVYPAFAMGLVLLYYLPGSVSIAPDMLSGVSKVASVGIILSGLPVIHWAASQTRWKGWVLLINYVGLFVFQMQWMLLLSMLTLINPWVPLHHMTMKQPITLNTIRNLISNRG